VLYSIEHLVRLDNISVSYEVMSKSKVNLLITFLKLFVTNSKYRFST